MKKTLKKTIPKLSLSPGTTQVVTRNIPATERIPSLKSLPKIQKPLPNDNAFFYLTANQKQGNYTSRVNVKEVTSSPGPPSKTRNKPSAAEKQRALFNKLYGISSTYARRYKEAQRAKDLPLEQYQNNLLKVLAGNEVDQDNIINLNMKFREIRLETQRVSPLPPMRLDEVEKYVRFKKESRGRRKTLKEYLSMTTIKSGFEKEFEENTRKFIAMPKPRKNKAYNLLPIHLIEAMEKKMKFHL